MIVTVTLNPTLEVRYDADHLELGAANAVSRVRHRAGGRGLAVARLLHIFGHEVVAAGLAGGSSGELIRAELARVGVASQFTRIGAESRRTVWIADAKVLPGSMKTHLILSASRSARSESVTSHWAARTPSSTT